MSLTGTWENSYGSIMTLHQSPTTGAILGNYKSSTGSTGTYYVVGFADPTDPTSERGQSAALSIYWRSIDGGTGDPSWHWVSGLSGQLIPMNGVNTLYLMHAMVATDDFPDVASIGTYIDKLIYVPASQDIGAPRPQFTDAPKDDMTGDPIEGTWTCRQEPSLQLALQVADTPYGLVNGTLSNPSGVYNVTGFTDITAVSGGLQLQALSLSTFDSDGGSQTCTALAGSLDFATGALTLTVFRSQGTSDKTLYVQTTIQELSFFKN